MKELNTEELQLKVIDKTLGSLTTNALSIKEKIEKKLPEYDAKNYNDIKKAENDRALLNNTATTLNKQRIELEKEFMAPFDTFKSIVADTCNIIKEASSKLDEIVKIKENEEKDIKKSDIQKYFDDNAGSLIDLISIDKIFNDRWLNKTYKIEEIYKEIDDKLSEIITSLETITSLNSKYEVELKNTYIKNLNLSEAIQKNKELIENEEKLASQSRTAEIDKAKLEDKKLQASANIVVEEKVFDPVETYTLKITGKRSQQIALKTFLKKNQMLTVNIETGKVIIG